MVYFCSIDCQKDHWVGHKTFCNTIKRRCSDAEDRRARIVRLKTELVPSAGEWWWATPQSLEEISVQLKLHRYVSIDDFLLAGSRSGVVEEIRKAESKGYIDQAGGLVVSDSLALNFSANIGLAETASGALLSTETRSDRVGWFHCSDQPVGAAIACAFGAQGEVDSAGQGAEWPALHRLTQLMETLLAELSSHDAGLGLGKVTKRSKGMLTCYDPRAFYKPHLDNAYNNGRRVTMIYYTNEDWRKEDGGNLRLYETLGEGDGGQKEAGGETSDSLNSRFLADVQPRGGRLVLFYSKELPHEVMKVKGEKSRYAFTVWFFHVDEHREFLTGT